MKRLASYKVTSPLLALLCFKGSGPCPDARVASRRRGVLSATTHSNFTHPPTPPFDAGTVDAAPLRTRGDSPWCPKPHVRKGRHPTPPRPSPPCMSCSTTMFYRDDQMRALSRSPLAGWRRRLAAIRLPPNLAWFSGAGGWRWCS